jgi:3-phosphoshikimate 1-carboxyvinyltransferase
LNELPYIKMTLNYLEMHLTIAHGGTRKAFPTVSSDFKHYRIEGGCMYKALNAAVPGDFSSAAFPALAAAVSGGRVVLEGLDPGDVQGDKLFFQLLERAGCKVEWRETNGGHSVLVETRGTGLAGLGEVDLNETPDLLPALAVLAAYSEGETRIVNAAHTRIKETDRIACIAAELGKISPYIGATIEEMPDGLVIRGEGRARCQTPGSKSDSKTGIDEHPIHIDSHADHRIAMAMGAAALGAPVPLTIEGAEAADVTYPGFWAKLDL